jgi:hypothetical protein
MKELRSPTCRESGAMIETENPVVLGKVAGDAARVGEGLVGVVEDGPPPQACSPGRMARVVGSTEPGRASGSLAAWAYRQPPF